MSSAFLVESVAILERTPVALDALVRGLGEPWIMADEGSGTWSPYTVLGHLIHCEKADWMPRIEMILAHGEARTFEPLDREAQLRLGSTTRIDDLLDSFRDLRRENLIRLRRMELGESELKLCGKHPAFGKVSLRELLATWTAHDLGHLVQIGRTMAKRYRDEVGPWRAYLSVMDR
jgi:hypothetical protein